jgi:hypothetical protein
MLPAMSNRTPQTRSRRGEPAWASLPDEALLDVRLCDLDLSLEGAPVLAWHAELLGELAARGLRVRPHVWLSDEWFTPTDVPGIAVPFYLAHPRLGRLERKMMLEVEGGSKRQGMRLLRHECGHAIQFAYRLHRRKRWQAHFGHATKPYPDAYRPRPYSRAYVLHLDNHYAQAHPDEDFAETFAVWLKPGSRWRKRYEGWPALRKLEYVDELMGEIAGRAPTLRSRRRVRPLRELRSTLREHYADRQRRYGLDQTDVYSRDLRRLFAEPVPRDRRAPASKALRQWRRDLLASVGRWTGLHLYTIDGVYAEMIERCRSLDLRVPDDVDEQSLKREAAVLLAVQTAAHVQRDGQWITV